jgi:hypothetical protein
MIQVNDSDGATLAANRDAGAKPAAPMDITERVSPSLN